VLPGNFQTCIQNVDEQTWLLTGIVGADLYVEEEMSNNFNYSLLEAYEVGSCCSIKKLLYFKLCTTSHTNL